MTTGETTTSHHQTVLDVRCPSRPGYRVPVKKGSVEEVGEDSDGRVGTFGRPRGTHTDLTSRRGGQMFHIQREYP